MLCRSALCFHESIQFKLDKFDPIKGAKRIFSMRAHCGIIKVHFEDFFVGFVFYVLFSEWMKMMVLTQVLISEAMVRIS